MELTDILTAKKWVALEKEIYSRSGLNASVFDKEGLRITDYEEWANRLCPVIRANEKGKSFICVAAHQNIASMAMKSKKPLTEECDAGLLKLVVPIFVGDEFLGTIGGCGLLSEDGEVDTFLINRTTDINEREVKSLSQDIKILPADEIDLLIEFIREHLDNAICDYTQEVK